MPCYATGSREGDMELSLNESNKEVTKLTRLLCEACGIIVMEIDAEFKDLASKRLNDWYTAHQKIDKNQK